MTEMLERAFLHEVVRQCVFADLAAGDLNDWTDPSRIDDTEGMDRVWYSVQGLLISLGNLSKLLWPREMRRSPGATANTSTEIEKRREERKRLRESLEVREDSPLRSVQLRNVFEHFDTELEMRAKKYTRPGSFPDSNLGPIDRWLGLDPEHLVRNLDVDSWILTFQDKPPLLLIEALEEVARVYSKASQLLLIPLPASR